MEAAAADKGDAFASGKNVLTAEDVARYNVRDIVELLNLLPGVSASTTGVTVQGSSSKSVAVILDGRPLFNPASGKVYLSGIPIQSIKEVRLLQGPAAASYVGNTGGGVIVITSKKGKKQYKNQLDVAYGGELSQPDYDGQGREQPSYYERKKAEASLGAGIGQVGFSLNALADLSDGDRVNDGDDKLAVKANVDFPFLAGLEASVAGMLSREEKGDPGKTYRLTPEASSATDEWGGSFLLRGRSFRNRLYVSSFHDETKNPPTGQYNALDSMVFGEEAGWSGDLGSVTALSFSGNAEYREIESSTYGGKDEMVGSLSASKKFAAAKDLSVVLGLKGNLYSEYDAQLNPQATVAWEPSPFSLSLLLERANTMPSFDQRYYESTSRLANPDLGLETLYVAKLKFHHRPWKFFSWGLTPFFIREQDKIEYYRFANVPKKSPLYGKAMYRNLSSTTSRGVIAVASFSPFAQTTLDAEWQYMEARNDDTGNTLFQKPRHKAKIRLRQGIGKLVAIAEAVYNGSRYDDSENLWRLPHNWKANAKLDYRFYKAWDAYLETNNIFDRRYYAYRGYPGERRSFLFGISYEI